MDKLKIVYVDISEVKPNEYNPKKLTEAQAHHLETSIVEFGIVDPLILNSADNRKNIIIGGHQRLKIYQKLKYTQVPVVYVNIPDIDKEKELCLRLSKNTGEWDLDLLANFDKDMLVDIGFELTEFDEIFGSEHTQNMPIDIKLKEILCVLVEVETEVEQQKLYEKLTREGYKCRLFQL